MCGIFGYVGEKSAVPILLGGLAKLEYRGYDSAGLYVSGGGSVKSVGQVKNLEAKVTSDVSGTCGIAHTRWATHGVPSEENAHPHQNTAGNIWLVHNGIIENYKEIKTKLKTEGVKFYSDTDTEVLAKLIGSFYNGDLYLAVVSALKIVQGTYGLAVIDKNEPESMVVAKIGSPIVIGLGDGCNFVSSDPSALLEYTKDIVHLDDEEIAIVTKDKYDIHSIFDKQKPKKIVEKIEGDYEQIQKNGYEHFMLKEIFEAPTVIENTIRGRLLPEKGKVKLGGLESILPDMLSLERLQIVGCGSAYYAGEVGGYLFGEYASLPVEVSLGSEYRYRKQFFADRTAVLAVSQSGETADTLASLKYAKENKVLTLGVVNAVGSTIARTTDAGIYNHAGKEIAVASTKAFISQLTVFALLTLLLGREREISKSEGQKMVKEIANLPMVLKEVLKLAPRIKDLSFKYAEFDNAIFVGRKFHAPIANEGALKLKEVSYIHAEGYAGGELKHGPIALLDKNLPIIALAPQDDVYEKMFSNIQEVKARQAPVLVFTTSQNSEVAEMVDDVVELPRVHPLVQPIVTTVALHLFAYYCGVAKGLDVDKPRNLAKSVTVE